MEAWHPKGKRRERSAEAEQQTRERAESRGDEDLVGPKPGQVRRAQEAKVLYERAMAERQEMEKKWQAERQRRQEEWRCPH